MNNNVKEKDLITEIQKIWSENKKSKELIKYFEILLNEKQDIDIELYLIYLNTLVNLGEHNKALLEVENNRNIINDREIIAFKIKLLFFLRRYKECENYIKSIHLDEDNKVLAERILNKINQNHYKKQPIEENKEKSVIESENNSLIKEEIDLNKELKTEVRKEADTDYSEVENIKEIEETRVIGEKNNKNKLNKSNRKIIIPIIIMILMLLGVGAYFLQKSNNNDVTIETYINLSTSDDLSKYKSSKSNIDYELPIDIEFEFVSAVESSNGNKKMYVTYKVSDENIATITDDGFFEGKKVGIVDIQTLNRKKVVDTITIEIIDKEKIQDKEAQEVLNNTSNEEKIQELLKNYEKDYVKAVNAGDYNIIKKYLVKGSPLDQEHSKNIKYFYENGISERLESLEFLSINKISDIEYLVNVKETIAIIKNGEEKVKEFDSFYSVILQDNGEYLISEMELRSTSEISSDAQEKLTVDKAINLCTEKLKEINWYDDSYGEGLYYGGERLVINGGEYRDYHKIIYNNEEIFYVDKVLEDKSVYYKVPGEDRFERL